MEFNWLFIVSALFLGSCEHDLRFYEAGELKGRLILEDTITGISGAIAPEATVYFSEGQPFTSIDENYLYLTKADKDGVFSFPFQPADRKDIVLTGKYAATTGILYQNSFPLNALPAPNEKGELEFKLNGHYPGGVLKVTWKENNVPVVGGEIFVFASESQALAINEDSPQGSVQKGTINENGVAVIYNLSPNTYYVIGRAKRNGVRIPSNIKMQKIEAADTKNFPGNMKYVKLNYAAVSQKPTIDVTVNVAGQGSTEPLARFYVYLFTSSDQAATISDEVVKGYIRMDSTDVNGKVSLKKVEKQKFYVGVRGFFGGKVLKSAYKPITVTDTLSYPLPFDF